MDRAETLLVEAALAGQTEAFDQLLAPYLPRAFRTACGITRQPETAADAPARRFANGKRSTEGKPGAGGGP